MIACIYVMACSVGWAEDAMRQGHIGIVTGDSRNDPMLQRSIELQQRFEKGVKGEMAGPHQVAEPNQEEIQEDPIKVKK